MAYPIEGSSGPLVVRQGRLTGRKGPKLKLPSTSPSPSPSPSTSVDSNIEPLHDEVSRGLCRIEATDSEMEITFKEFEKTVKSSGSDGKIELAKRMLDLFKGSDDKTNSFIELFKKSPEYIFKYMEKYNFSDSQRSMLYRYLDDSLKIDQTFVLKFSNTLNDCERTWLYKYLEDSLKKDQAFILKFSNPLSSYNRMQLFSALGVDLKENREFVLEFVKDLDDRDKIAVFCKIADCLKKDQQFILNFVEGFEFNYEKPNLYGKLELSLQTNVEFGLEFFTRKLDARQIVGMAMNLPEGLENNQDFIKKLLEKMISLSEKAPEFKAVWACLGWKKIVDVVGSSFKPSLGKKFLWSFSELLAGTNKDGNNPELSRFELDQFLSSKSLDPKPSYFHHIQDILGKFVDPYMASSAEDQPLYVLEQLKKREEIYISFVTCESTRERHATVIRFGLNSDTNEFELSVYNSGAGLRYHSNKEYKKKKKFQTEKRFTISVKEEARLLELIKGIIYRSELDLQGFYMYIKDEFKGDNGERTVDSTHVFQSAQKSGNCSLECLMATLNNKLKLRDYLQFRLDLALWVLEMEPSFSVLASEDEGVPLALQPSKEGIKEGIGDSKKGEVIKVKSCLEQQVEKRRLKIKKLDEFIDFFHRDFTDIELFELVDTTTERDFDQITRLRSEETTSDVGMKMETYSRYFVWKQKENEHLWKLIVKSTSMKLNWRSHTRRVIQDSLSQIKDETSTEDKRTILIALKTKLEIIQENPINKFRQTKGKKALIEDTMELINRFLK